VYRLWTYYQMAAWFKKYAEVSSLVLKFRAGRGSEEAIWTDRYSREQCRCCLWKVVIGMPSE